MTDHMKGTAMAPRTAPLSAWAAQATHIKKGEPHDWM